MGIGAVILAAGASSRMGTPKQILQFQGQSLVLRSALAAIDGGCAPVIVVTGASAGAVRSELQKLDVIEAWNAAWASGLASSIRIGIQRVAANPDIAAVILMVADQPHVRPQVIRDLIGLHEASGRAVVASRYAATAGVPALFTRALFPELLHLPANAGAKQVIEKRAAEAAFIDFEKGSIDIDTPDDFARFVADESPR